MNFRRTSFVGAIALLLIACTSCQVEELDSNGDGIVTKSELLSAAFDAVCGDQTEPETPDDETPDGETPDNETPDGELPDDETDGEESSQSGF